MNEAVEQLLLKNHTLQARIEEMHTENSLVYEKLEEAKALLIQWDRIHRHLGLSTSTSLLNTTKVSAEMLLQEAMDIVHGYTDPKLTPPQEGN